MQTEKLTKRQEEILGFVIQSTNLNGYPPSIREICEHFHLSSSSTVFNHLSALERKGYIVRESAKTRAIHIVDRRERKPLQSICESIVADCLKDPMLTPGNIPEIVKKYTELHIKGDLWNN